MALRIDLPPNAGPKTKALADQIRSMENDPLMQNSDQDFRDTAIRGLFAVVAELERQVDALTEASAARARDDSMADLMYRSYGGDR